jgi:hypothetical protein
MSVISTHLISCASRQLLMHLKLFPTFVQLFLGVRSRLTFDGQQLPQLTNFTKRIVQLFLQRLQPA